MIGHRIKEERLKYKYSRETFAELIDITPQHLFNVESGRRRLSYEKLAKVCEVLNVTADYLLFGYPIPANDLGKITGLLNTMEPEHVELAAELIITYLKGIGLAKREQSQKEY